MVERYPPAGDVVEGVFEQLTEENVEKPQRRKVKRWFGIWE